jgi:Ankyrin repeats (3 copies)/Ankyrin repeats (many copies)
LGFPANHVAAAQKGMTSKKSKAAVASSHKLIRDIKNSQLKTVRRLVDHDSVDINATNDVGETPLYCASRVGHLKIVQYLVNTGRTNLDATNKSGETILHLASRYGHVQVVQYLVESCSANVESSNNDGDTALHWACRYGHHRVVQYLVTKSQVSVEAANNEGWTALHIASRYARDLTIVEYLVETGDANIHAVTKSDETALGVTKTSGLHSVVAYLQGRLEMAKSDGCTVEDSSYRLILERPSTWGNSPADSTNVAVPVSQLDDQYWTVAQKLQETIPDAHISALWRIQNTALWWYYSFHKHRMALSGTAANEMALWHGTRQVDPSVIYNDQQDGFMVQHSKDGYWGYVCLSLFEDVIISTFC